jgi:predicted phosphodiesterase
MSAWAFFSDVHGNAVALDAVLADIDARKLQGAFCLGDLVGYGPDPNGVVEAVRDRGIPAIMGNYDEGVAFERGECGCFYSTTAAEAIGKASYEFTVREVTPENKEWLRALPGELTIELEGRPVHLVHGSPRRINEYLTEDRDERTYDRLARAEAAEVLLFGHTHTPWHGRYGEVLFVNVGSAGWPKDGDSRVAYTILRVPQGASKPELEAAGGVDAAGGFIVEVVRVAYAVEETAREVAARGLPQELADCFRRGVGLP